MTEEETRSTMLGVAELTAEACSLAIKGAAEGGVLDPETIEDLLASALRKSIEEIDGFDGDGSRNQLLGALVRFQGG